MTEQSNVIILKFSENTPDAFLANIAEMMKTVTINGVTATLDNGDGSSSGSGDGSGSSGSGSSGSGSSGSSSSGSGSSGSGSTADGSNTA